MTTAFVLSGGGSLGADQVGVLQALTARGVEPDLLIGMSAGALNAAYVAGHGASDSSLDGLEALWTRRRRDVFSLQPARLGAAALGWAPSLCPNGSLRRLIRDNLAFDRLEDARIPLHVVATDVGSGQEVQLSAGDPVDAVLASAAIPAVFRSIRNSGRDLIDGGVADNAAVSQAVTLGADIVYVVPTGYAGALEQPPATPLASALQALTLVIEQTSDPRSRPLRRTRRHPCPPAPRPGDLLHRLPPRRHVLDSAPDPSPRTNSSGALP